jgi:hypothetical protein
MYVTRLREGWNSCVEITGCTGVPTVVLPLLETSWHALSTCFHPPTKSISLELLETCSRAKSGVVFRLASLLIVLGKSLFTPWGWSQIFPPKLLFLPTVVHGVTSQRTMPTIHQLLKKFSPLKKPNIYYGFLIWDSHGSFRVLRSGIFF